MPDVPDVLTELARAMGELDALGAVLETNHHGRYLGDSTLEELYAELACRGGVVPVYPTSPSCGVELALSFPSPMIEFIFETTRAIGNLVIPGVLERNPRLKVIVSHARAVLPVTGNAVRSLPSLANTVRP